jgi:hypothetical protein
MTARKLARLLILLLLSAVSAPAEPVVHFASWTSGVYELKQGWKTHSGDNRAWAASDILCEIHHNTSVGERLNSPVAGYHKIRRRLGPAGEVSSCHLQCS